MQAMEIILTSATVSGEELHRLGVVAQTFPEDEVLDAAIACASKIASRSAPVVQLAKQAILNGLCIPTPYFELASTSTCG